MTIKILGAIMVFLTCGWTGYRVASFQRKEERGLRQLLSILDYMECELQYRMTPLPELCKQAAGQERGNLGKLFLQLSLELENQVAPDAARCMDAALMKCKRFTTTVTEQLQSLGQSLGRFDLRGQLVGFQAVKESCKTELNKLSHNSDVRLRSYQTLGLCAGAALAILFI